jgi:methionine sulfoxide reductase catalytic subunit
MALKMGSGIRSSEITPKQLFLDRREFLLAAAFGAAGTVAGARAASVAEKLNLSKRLVTTTDAPTSRQAITTFNNFYEFGTDKADPVKNSKTFKPRPWSVAVEGLCNKPGSYTLEDILKPHALEDRVYRHRCVEGWSMVIPWVGFPLGDALKRFEPTGSAKFVEFTTVLRPEEMVGQRRRFLSSLSWPYVEGLRLDEAMHPLTILGVGVYGEELLNQNGAPLRLVVPWKYGFKSIKSIVKIKFVDKQPKTSWQISAPEYYAFYSNVNPGQTYSTFRDQSTERRIGEFFMRKTLMFNGYGDQVASLYSGLDLRKNY